VTVAVPTYREVEDIPPLVEGLARVREDEGLDLELLLVQRDGADGSAGCVERLRLPWVRLVPRTGARGPGQAVLDALRRSRADVLVVMDADPGHPPEKLPELLEALERGADVAVGSRFAPGSTGDGRARRRRLGSRLATLLARPLTRLADPTSGFLAMRRARFLSGTDLSPVCHQLGLELVVKCRCRSVVEVPIPFGDRRRRSGEPAVAELLEYLRHLRRLYVHRYGVWSHLAQFLAVGSSGLAVNIAVLTALLALRIPHRAAIGVAIALSMAWNFALNRRFSFSYARARPLLPQLCGFVAACSVGAVVNYGVTAALWATFEHGQIAAGVGVLAGTAFNFASSRFLVFRTGPPGRERRAGRAGAALRAPPAPSAGGRSPAGEG
jgi:dolichol-phosphate mannosyltransferase